jgi:hypothetical protein
MYDAAAQSAPPFPRLGAYLIGGSVQSAFGTTGYQQQVARLGAAVIGTYPGWSSGGFNMQSAAAAVKAINPNIKLTMYANIMEFESGSSAGNSAYYPLWTAVSSNNWFLRNTWPSGSIVSDTSGLQAINIANGSYLQWRANYDAGNHSASFDGIYLDNVFWAPRSDGDYAQNGTVQSHANATTQQNWRNAYAAYVGHLRAALPAGAQVWGNTADWGNGSLSGYSQMLNGGVMESFIGQSYSYESQGWAVMMSAYRTIMAATTASGYQIFEQDGSAGDYQGMRYGLTACLMDNAYYYFNVTGPGGGSAITWFDEFNASLGAATSSPPTGAWQNGVYRRDFQNGIALVNPKGNGPQTVTLETTYKHLSGTQVPSINNGQSVTTVTLNDRDGVILLRTTAQAVPDAPTLTVQ